MSTDKKIDLPEHIEKMLVGLNSGSSAEKLAELKAKAVEQIENNKKLAIELKDNPLSQTRAYTTIACIMGNAYMSGTNMGSAINESSITGQANNMFSRFAVSYDLAQNIGRSYFSVCRMGSVVAGTFWVVAKRGPNPTTGNYVSVLGSYDAQSWYYVGEAKVTQPSSAANGYNYIIGSVSNYAYYLVGVAAMGGVNPDCDIQIDAAGITY
jgi:hypothetical protein